MRTVAGVLALVFLLDLPKANAFSTKSTCKLLNSENNFVDLTDESSSCAESCLSKGKSYAECKCKLKGIPTKVSFQIFMFTRLLLGQPILTETPHQNSHTPLWLNAINGIKGPVVNLATTLLFKRSIAT